MDVGHGARWFGYNNNLIIFIKANEYLTDQISFVDIWKTDVDERSVISQHREFTALFELGHVQYKPMTKHWKPHLVDKTRPLQFNIKRADRQYRC